MLQNKRSIWTFLLSGVMSLLIAGTAFAGEADIKLPDLTTISFLGGALQGITILNVGLVICLIGMIFGIIQYVQNKKSARTQSNARRIPDNLGNLQNLSFPAG